MLVGRSRGYMYSSIDQYDNIKNIVVILLRSRERKVLFRYVGSITGRHEARPLNQLGVFRSPPFNRTRDGNNCFRAAFHVSISNKFSRADLSRNRIVSVRGTERERKEKRSDAHTVHYRGEISECKFTGVLLNPPFVRTNNA